MQGRVTGVYDYVLENVSTRAWIEANMEMTSLHSLLVYELREKTADEIVGSIDKEDMPYVVGVRPVRKIVRGNGACRIRAAW